MIKRRFAIGLAAGAFGLTYFAAAANHPAGLSADEKPKISHTNLKVGDTAPDFTLLDNNWKKVHLADYRGKKNVVLAFYVLAFTGG
jgi:cytochrome oxidase Cu insertion factor (SCO1/SenC/PrrC family)